jgi:acyl-CoA thioesterase-1
MQAPQNMGNDYTRQFGAIFPRLAKQYNAQLIPFLLDGVASIPSLNLADGKHPNVEGPKDREGTCLGGAEGYIKSLKFLSI